MLFQVRMRFEIEETWCSIHKLSANKINGMNEILLYLKKTQLAMIFTQRTQ